MVSKLSTTSLCTLQEGGTALMAASLNGHIQIVDKLLQQRAHPDLQMTVVQWYRIRTYFCKYKFSWIASNALRKLVHGFSFFLTVPEGRIYNLMNILCSSTHQYECDDVLDGFWGLGDGCWSDTGSKSVPGIFFENIKFRSLGFICDYNKNLYTSKISTLVCTC